jgi:hypothetical protein
MKKFQNVKGNFEKEREILSTKRKFQQTAEWIVSPGKSESSTPNSHFSS